MMPNIFRSKHKQAASGGGPIRGIGGNSDRMSPSHPSVSVANRPIPTKDSGLLSPPRSPEGKSATLPNAGGAYFDPMAAGEARGGERYRSSVSSSSQHMMSMQSDSTLASGITTNTSGSRHVSSAGTSAVEAGDKAGDMDMADGTRGPYHDPHHDQAQHYPSPPHHQQHHQQPPRHQHQPQGPPLQQPKPYYQQQPQQVYQQQAPPQHGYAQPQVQAPPQLPVQAVVPGYAMQAIPSSTSQASARKTASRYALGDFALIRTLGTGSFGRVHLAKSRHNGRSYAIKVLSKDRVVKMKQVEHTNSEREMLERVRHPFLVNLWGTFTDPKYLYMVMDFVAGGELFSLLRKSQRFPDPVAKFFGAEVALGLNYLHSMDIIYRDLKPENILLGADGHIKITDFGFAKYVPDITWTLCGTPDYLAPEIVQSKGYNKSVDWYALGVLIFEMLAGYPPFFTEDSNPMKLYEKITAGKIRYPSYFSPNSKDLLKSLLTGDLTKRFGNLANGSRDVFDHVWFSEVDWDRLYRKEIPAPYVPRVQGEWDSSNFDQYPEVDLNEYGQPGADPHGDLFPSF